MWPVVIRALEETASINVLNLCPLPTLFYWRSSENLGNATQTDCWWRKYFSLQFHLKTLCMCFHGIVCQRFAHAEPWLWSMRSKFVSWQTIDFITSCDFFETLGLVKDYRPVVFDVQMCHLRIREGVVVNNKFRLNWASYVKRMDSGSTSQKALSIIWLQQRYTSLDFPSRKSTASEADAPKIMIKLHAHLCQLHFQENHMCSWNDTWWECLKHGHPFLW